MEALVLNSSKDKVPILHCKTLWFVTMLVAFEPRYVLPSQMPPCLICINRPWVGCGAVFDPRHIDQQSSTAHFHMLHWKCSFMNNCVYMQYKTKKKAGWIYCSSIGLFHNDDFKLFFIQIPTCIKLWTPPQCGQHSAMMLCTCNCSWLVSASSSSSLSSPTGEMLASVLRNSCFGRWTSPFLELNASYGDRRRD